MRRSEAATHDPFAAFIDSQAGTRLAYIDVVSV
jgi:hypothetical protein